MHIATVQYPSMYRTPQSLDMGWMGGWVSGYNHEIARLRKLPVVLGAPLQVPFSTELCYTIYNLC